jgi:hypothetical protein
MTLRDLKDQGLFLLPTDRKWGLKNADESLVLLRVQMWGYQKGNDNGIRLLCKDSFGNAHEAEITHFSECLSRAFMTRFLVDNYGKSIDDIYTKELKTDDLNDSIFESEFTHPFFVDNRLRKILAAETN